MAFNQRSYFWSPETLQLRYLLDSRNLQILKQECWKTVDWAVACDIYALRGVTKMETLWSFRQLQQILWGSRSGYCCYFLQSNQ